MSERYILVLELGGSGVRAFLAPQDAPWALKQGHSLPYRVLQAKRDPRSAQFSASDLSARVLAVIGKTVRQHNVGGNDIAAISITCQPAAVAFLDKAGKTIYVGPSTDLRAVAESAEIDAGLGGEIYNTTGHPSSPALAAAKLHWWRRHHPRIAKRISAIVSLGGWAAHQLTGEAADSPLFMSELGLMDVAAKQPSVSLLERLGLGADMLPSQRSEGEMAGGVTTNVAQATGLVAGTPVILAGPDAQMGLLGMGVRDPGHIGIGAGWNTTVQVTVTGPVFDLERHVSTGIYPVEGLWYVGASAGNAGAVYDVVRQMLGNRPYAKMDELASRTPYGADLVTAFWVASGLTAQSMNMGGLLAPAPITYNRLTASHISRATMENIAYAIKESMELVARASGWQPRSVRLTGGMSKSSVFPQLLTDVLGKDTRVYHHDASAIGAGIMAAPAERREELLRQATAQGRRLDPDIRSTLEYRHLYERWLRLRAKLRKMDAEL